jgi:DNA-directed RNA polymerase subunit beta'
MSCSENLLASEKNLLKPATGAPVITPQQDIALGCYFLTKYDETDIAEVKKFFSNSTEAKFAYKCRRIALRERIKVRFDDVSKFPEGTAPIVETSLGRVLFNEIFSARIPYFNETITKKHLSTIIGLLLEHCGQEETARLLDDIKSLGFKYVTKSGYSLGMDDFVHIKEKAEILHAGDGEVEQVQQQYEEGLLTDAERHSKVLEVWTQVKDKVLSYNKRALDRDGSVFAMIDSGARGSLGQLGQVIGMKGLVASPSGDIIELPVKGNFKEGFSVLEFFISSHGTRKGLSDTALRTANAGYLTRRLVDVAQDVVVLEDDCGDTDGAVVTKKDTEDMGEKMSDRITGRFALADIKIGRKTVVGVGEIITEAAARLIDKSGLTEVHVRSVLRCHLPKGICQKCYGFDLAHNKLVNQGVAVGIIAAQSIGEPGTQLTMRTFHLGGVAGGDITQGLPRVEELFEARRPKRVAVLSEVGGTIEIEEAEGKVITGPTGRKIFEGRRGQKIIKAHFEGIDEFKIKFKSADDVQVAEGQKVKQDDVLLVRGDSGEEIKAKYDGTVSLEKNSLTLTFEGRHTKEYIIPLGYKLWVSNGDQVEKGQQLTEGAVDLHELYELKGRKAVQDYILREIKAIYSSQGQRLNDKHVELIIKQMFSRVYVEDAGDTDLLPGEVVEKSQLVIANEHMKKEGKKEGSGRELFLGVSKISLSTQSFLSSASFQETARVLINAAVTGKIDYLVGLKENVIIGRRIPAGTGFYKNK